MTQELSLGQWCGPRIHSKVKKCLLFNWQVSVPIGRLTLCQHALHGHRRHRPCCEGILSLIREILELAVLMEETVQPKIFIHSVNIYFCLLYFMPETELGIEDAGTTTFHGVSGFLELSAAGEMCVKQSHQRLSCVMTAAKKIPGLCEWLGRWQFGQWGSRKASLRQ